MCFVSFRLWFVLFLNSSLCIFMLFYKFVFLSSTPWIFNVLCPLSILKYTVAAPGDKLFYFLRSLFLFSSMPKYFLWCYLLVFKSIRWSYWFIYFNRSLCLFILFYKFVFLSSRWLALNSVMTYFSLAHLSGSVHPSFPFLFNCLSISAVHALMP